MFGDNGMFNGMFGKIKNGLCRYSMDGKIAIKTSTGYKTYDVKTNTLINCDNFAFDIGEDFFFLIPTNSVTVGDIILVNGKPNVVISNDNNFIKVFNYETSAVTDIVPEQHMFMGKTYFYGKIISLFGTGAHFDENNLMKYMMMSQMMGNNNSNNSMNNMLPMMMMMNGGFNNMFDNLFDNNSSDKEAK